MQKFPTIKSLLIFFGIVIFVFLLIMLIKKPDKTPLYDKSVSGDLIIFHAGSLSVPMKEIVNEFKKENPDVNVMLEAAGSLECARKITELKKPCDIMASADYTVIDKLLIPQYTDWNIKFASNEMAIVYTTKSKKNQEINKNNWHKIMLDSSVQIGRADPNTDPCGYRSVLVAKLSEKYYKYKGLADLILKKDANNIRPKETDLIALLETGNLDYIFLYRSVAEQHKLKYILLPDEVNLKNPEFSELYGSVSVEINGKTPQEKITQNGEPMVYGLTIPKNAPNKKAAIEFVEFLLSEGMMILNKLGQPSVIPAYTPDYNKIPIELQHFAKKQ